VKETGKLQVALSASPSDYEGLDYLDPFFKELKPPFVSAFMLTDFAEEKEIRKAKAAYETLGNLRYFAHVREKLKNLPLRSLDSLIKAQFGTYAALKLGNYPIIDEIESLMVDNPEKAIYVLGLCSFFLIEPIIDLRSDQRNFSFDIIRDADHELGIYKPEKYFPCER
jgi:hypothetical protein